MSGGRTASDPREGARVVFVLAPAPVSVDAPRAFVLITCAICCAPSRSGWTPIAAARTWRSSAVVAIARFVMHRSIQWDERRVSGITSSASPPGGRSTSRAERSSRRFSTPATALLALGRAREGARSWIAARLVSVLATRAPGTAIMRRGRLAQGSASRSSRSRSRARTRHRQSGVNDPTERLALAWRLFRGRVQTASGRDVVAQWLPLAHLPRSCVREAAGHGLPLVAVGRSVRARRLRMAASPSRGGLLPAVLAGDDVAHAEQRRWFWFYSDEDAGFCTA